MSLFSRLAIQCNNDMEVSELGQIDMILKKFCGWTEKKLQKSMLFVKSCNHYTKRDNLMFLGQCVNFGRDRS